MTAERAQPRHGSLSERWRRNRLTGVPWASRAWVIAAWLLSAALLTALVWPGALASIAPTPLAPAITAFDLPLWFRILAAVCGAVLAATTMMLAIERPDDRPRRRSIVSGLLAMAPGLLLLADRAWVFAIAALLLAGGALVVRRLAPQPGIAIVLASTGWLVLGGAQFSAPGSSPTSWVWIVLVGLGAATAAFGTYYGVAGAAEGRTGRLAALFRAPSVVVGLGISLAAVGVVLLRLTVLRDLFPAPDAQLWTISGTTAVSWLLAALVGGVLAAVTVRSSIVPLLPGGQRGVTAGLALLGNLHLIVGAAVVLVAAAAAAAGLAAVDPGWQTAVPALKVAGVVAMGALVLHPRFRGTAARWLIVVAVLFLLPATLQGLLGTEPRFAPTPVQVVIVAVIAALGLGVARLAGARIAGDAVVRLAVIPLIAVHAGWLLPAAWTPLGLALGAALIVAAALFAGPEPEAPGRDRAHQSLATASARLATLAIALLAAPALLDDPSLIVLGLVWLSVVISAALCFTTTPAATATTPAASAKATVQE